MRQVAVIAIGRNEGERLKTCLRSLPGDSRRIYVDSGSTDGSVAFARDMGVEVLELPPGTRFTAALARNTGLAALSGDPTVRFVQMVDGDCELDQAWLPRGVEALEADPQLGVVFGRVKERHPDASIYNALCDHEWDVPLGDAKACGGNALFRCAALGEAGGYAEDLIAGEEPELCLRMRARGWRVRRIEGGMVLHDAAMTRFRQWWRRTERSGHAFAELSQRHGAAGDPAWRGQVRSILAWGAVLPLAIAGLALATGGWGLLALAIYPAQVVRLARRERRAGLPARFAAALAFFLTLGKIPQAIGVARFGWRRLTGRRGGLIEYKGPAARAA